MPKITVLMPAYNAAPFLQEAIDSIMAQTFADFELLIIEDGSTDNSKVIIESYNDPRIILVPNIKNEGVTACLNKGLVLARGEYIARMDADDVCMPQRLEIQLSYLDTHPDVSMVAAKAVLIDVSGIEKGYWQQDQLTNNCNQIYEMLPKTNCIVHPSVMIRTAVALSFGYSKIQRTTEDYDLWLRLAACNHRIEKIDSVLVKYRIHENSVTVMSNASGGEFKECIARLVFLVDAAQKICQVNSFHFNVFKYLIHDFIRICQNISKTWFLAAARHVLISVGKLFGYVCHEFARSDHGVLLFLPFSFKNIGGAERIHSDIVFSNISKSPWVVLANEWHDEPEQAERETAYRLSNISRLLRNPFTKNLLIGFFAGYINRAKSVAFGGNCEFFYWLIPHLDPKIFCIDFIHGFGGLVELISLPHVPRINRRIIIAEELRISLARLYHEHKIAEKYLERLQMVDYGVEIPKNVRHKSDNEVLNVIYVGRGAEEKRVHLVGQISKNLAMRNLPVSVSLVGDVHNYIAVEDREYCTYYGVISDRKTLDDLYRKADVLIITSRSEGLPLVMMEAMSNGVVPVCVAVGGIPSHIDDGVTGFLVSPDQEEDEIVLEFCRIIEELLINRSLLHRISYQAYEFASSHFDRSVMLAQFAKIFDE